MDIMCVLINIIIIGTIAIVIGIVVCICITSRLYWLFKILHAYKVHITPINLYLVVDILVMIRPKPTKGSDVHNNPTARVPFYGLVCLSNAFSHWVSPHTIIGVGPPGKG